MTKPSSLLSKWTARWKVKKIIYIPLKVVYIPLLSNFYGTYQVWM